jgi:hypothetical protein
VRKNSKQGVATVRHQEKKMPKRNTSLLAAFFWTAVIETSVVAVLDPVAVAMAVAVAALVLVLVLVLVDAKDDDED